MLIVSPLARILTYFCVSARRTARPVFLELPSWPTLNFDGDPGSCPFDTKKQERIESKLINREVKENKEDSDSVNKEEVRFIHYYCGMNVYYI